MKPEPGRKNGSNKRMQANKAAHSQRCWSVPCGLPGPLPACSRVLRCNGGTIARPAVLFALFTCSYQALVSIDVDVKYLSLIVLVGAVGADRAMAC